MKNIEDLKKMIIKFIREDIKTTLKETHDDSFAWEIYFNVNLPEKYVKLLTSEIMKTMSKNATLEDNNNLKIISDFIADEQNNADVKDCIMEMKEDLVKRRILRFAFIEDFEIELIKFFREKRSINFLMLNEKEKRDMLINEDITGEDEKIYKYLNITHMQYKYLYQKDCILGVFMIKYVK